MYGLHGSAMILVLLLLCLLKNLGQNDAALRMITQRVCGCFGETLTYECTVLGSTEGATVWTGSALNCPSNEITLLHRRFTESGGTIRSCNNGATVAQSLYVHNNQYTSQFNITVTCDIAGNTIMCAYDSMGDCNTMSTMSWFSMQISGLFPSPTNVHISIADFSSRELTFTWSPATHNCPAVHYNILASDCGSFPTTTNHTTATCTDVPASNSVCSFAVQTVLCGNLVGNLSDIINTTISLERSTDTCMCTNTAYVIATSSLAMALITSVVIFVTTIVIILRKSKARIKAALDLQQADRAEGSTHMESVYEDVTGPPPSVNAINTQDNVAYGHTKTDNTCM